MLDEGQWVMPTPLPVRFAMSASLRAQQCANHTSSPTQSTRLRSTEGGDWRPPLLSLEQGTSDTALLRLAQVQDRAMESGSSSTPQFLPSSRAGGIPAVLAWTAAVLLPHVVNVFLRQHNVAKLLIQKCSLLLSIPTNPKCQLVEPCNKLTFQ